MAMVKAAPDICERISGWLVALETAHDLPELLRAEAQAAAWYWGAWERLPIEFGIRDSTLVPDHWKSFGQRRSLHGHGPRAATNAANAMLNYLYALLEAECRLACLAIGLDPGLGIFHTDQQSRDSMALDLMEALRPHADAMVLKDLIHGKLRRRDFSETPDGTVRVAPVVEHVARTLAHRSGRRGRLPTPLTHDNNSTAQDDSRKGVRREPTTPPTPNTCGDCGLVLERRDRLYCDQCLSTRRLGRSENIKAAHKRLREMRAAGDDPGSRRNIRRKIGASNRSRQQAIMEWEASHGREFSADLFRSDILPGLQDVAVTRMAVATGLSIQYCSRIRSGRNVPHPMHWQALSELT
jgi:hypothetical protein